MKYVPWYWFPFAYLSITAVNLTGEDHLIGEIQLIPFGFLPNGVFSVSIAGFFVIFLLLTNVVYFIHPASAEKEVDSVAVRNLYILRWPIFLMEAGLLWISLIQVAREHDPDLLIAYLILALLFIAQRLFVRSSNPPFQLQNNGNNEGRKAAFLGVSFLTCILMVFTLIGMDGRWSLFNIRVDEGIADDMNRIKCSEEGNTKMLVIDGRDLRGAYLSNTEFCKVNMTVCDLRSANLTYSIFPSSSRFKDVVIDENTRLQQTKFDECFISGDWSQADISLTFFHGCDLTKLKLDPKQLELAGPSKFTDVRWGQNMLQLFESDTNKWQGFTSSTDHPIHQ